MILLVTPNFPLYAILLKLTICNIFVFIFIRKNHSAPAIGFAQTGRLLQTQVDSHSIVFCAHSFHGAKSERKSLERGFTSRMRPEGVPRIDFQ